MKRCPKCNRVETEEALKFCRVDGALLIEDSAVGDESSATRILPASHAAEQDVLADTAQPRATTSALHAGAQSKPRGGDLKEERSGSNLISAIKQHKIAVLLALVVIVAGIVGVSVYLHARSKEVAIGSIAVLPFVNQNNDPNAEYLSDGITESIIGSLAQLPNLKVMARTTVFRYKGQATDPQRVGKELGVGAVLTGKVLQRGDTLVIRTDLVKASDGSELWGEQYTRKLADVFAVQQEIAQEISDKLRVKLTGAEQKRLSNRPTENLKAFQYYMQGSASRQRNTREDLFAAIRYYEKALEEDPNYALGYAGLADAYGTLGAFGYIAPTDGRRKEEEFAGKALALDDYLGEAHAALGIAYVGFVPANFALGQRELQRAIELTPSLALAHFYLGISLAGQGLLDESLAEYRKARELDPLSSTIARSLALPYYLKRDYVRALELLRQADELGPRLSTTWEIGVYIHNNLSNETLSDLEKAKRERKDDSLLIYDTGMIYAGQGERAEALQIIKEMEEMSGSGLSQSYWIARIYSALGDKEQAFMWLERALAAGAIGAFYKDDPVWDPIRSDQRFPDLLRRMGIQQ